MAFEELGDFSRISGLAMNHVCLCSIPPPRVALCNTGYVGRFTGGHTATSSKAPIATSLSAFQSRDQTLVIAFMLANRKILPERSFDGGVEHWPVEDA